MKDACDVCVIGSGAGGGPVAFTLAKAGYKVIVLEKGPWLTEQDFYKDELACCRRRVYVPDLKEEPHVVEIEEETGGWVARSTGGSGWDFWNGNCVGGSTNFMSGFFYRLKPVDFRLLSTFGPIEDAHIVDWPISYEDLEPYYTLVEREVGVSGKVVLHPHNEPRSTPDFPYPPTQEHPITEDMDKACRTLGFNVFPTPRAILPFAAMGRKGCAYSGYCGSYGCATGAKGSSRVALINRAVATGHCEVLPKAMVYRLETGGDGKVISAHYFGEQGTSKTIRARIFVVACQAIETARLLLLSKGPKHPNGLGNSSNLVGRNLLFAGGGAGFGWVSFAKFGEQLREDTFINRTLQDWYVIRDPNFGQPQKGGTVSFSFEHPAPIARATQLLEDRDKKLVWGHVLKRKLERRFRGGRFIKLEAFCDWLPIDNCLVTLDKTIKDKWHLPVAKIRVAFHPKNLQVGWYLASHGAEVLKQMGAEDVIAYAVGSPPTNLVAGTCRFGKDPKTSVLDPDCRAHEVENLFVTDGSFMPTGGSAPYTWTIYANAFRVADRIKAQLS
ncbi:MAG: GMC family oxidoreductase [Gammaproteobacteria bacterium]|nr:GMC family oxidoreductase [Gammaproteobacteria bacterium]